MKSLIVLTLAISWTFAANAQQPNPFNGVPDQVMAKHKQINGANCEYDPSMLGEPAEIDDLGHGFKLYLIPCGQGAYQAGFSGYYAKADLSDIEPLIVVDWDDQVGLVANSYLMEAGYDAKKGLLYTSAKGRGIGDCGQSGIWKVIVDDYTVKTKIVELRSKPKCDGKMTDWPIVFPRK